MNILFLETDSPGGLDYVAALGADGHHVDHARSLHRALSTVRTSGLDLLIAALFPAGDATLGGDGLTVVLTAEFHNPQLLTILLTDSPVFMNGELFEMFSSLRWVLPRGVRVADLLEITRHLRGAQDCVLPMTSPADRRTAHR
ncbi:hypothetical protein [Phaeovulum sp.]|uniref:hypothetical protein n=1 Tax=Phaeovulum sp. TaxID=2934796 RepID=UPI0039E2AC7C